MVKATIPKDLAQVQSKVFLNLTKRQVICFLPALALGLPVFFLTRNALGLSGALLLMMFLMMPFLFAAFYKHNDEYFEKYIGHLLQTVFIRTKDRPYKTDNFYEILERQDRLEKEVRKICRKEKR